MCWCKTGLLKWFLNLELKENNPLDVSEVLHPVDIF